MQETEQIMRIHEKIISIMKTKSLTEALNSSILKPNKVEETALYLATQSLLMSRYLKSDASAYEVACASVYMSFKVCEKKTGLQNLMTQALFNDILSCQGDQTS